MEQEVVMLQDIAYCARGDLGSRVVRMGEQRGDTGLALASLQHQHQHQLHHQQHQHQHQQQQPLTPQSNHQHQNNRPGSDAVNSSSNNNNNNDSGSVRAAAQGSYGGKIMDPPDEFPAGMKVLVVDDDPVCLAVLERLLRKCSYRVTTCGRAADALSLLREDISKFDLVISDVYMPDMDGFKLLELVGLEMDLPVIMMSGNGEKSAVMKGITHGACDYLLKPVRIEELRNIWQHVVRKKRQETKEVGHSKSLDEGGDRQKRGGVDDNDYTSSATDTDGNWKCTKKRKESKEEEEDNEQENDDPSTMKKPRVVWSVELHQQFVSAVNQLGIDKAVPKRILELMGVHGLTRENVASHLQKYRLYLKRISGVSTQQNNMDAHFGGSDSFMMSPEGMGLNGLTPQAMAPFSILGRLNSSSGIGLSNGLHPMLSQFLLQGLPGPHIDGMLKTSSSLLPTLPSGLHLDQLPETAHHLPLMNELDDIPSNSKVFPQMNGNCDLGVGSFGGSSGNLSSPIELMRILHSRQGGGSPANLSQPRGGLGPPHLLPNELNFGPVGSLPTLLGNLGPGIGLPAMSGSGGRDPSPSIGAGTSLSSALVTSVHLAPLADEQPHLVNSAAGTFSMAVSVESPKAGGGPGPSPVHEVLNQQQSLWTPFNPPSHQNQGQHTQRYSQSTSPAWLGYTENLGLGDLGPALSSGMSPQFSTQVQNYGGGLLDCELSSKFNSGWRNGQVFL